MSRLDRSKGAPLAYRTYSAPGAVAVLAVHGSSATSTSLHPLGIGLQRAGIAVYTFDVRGHGASEPRGTVAYRGQLDDDLRALAEAIRKQRPGIRLGLLGFSSGGGYALHVAGSELGNLFDFHVFLAPFLGLVDGVTRLDGGWAVANIPRIVALSAVSRLGLTAFDNLPVLAFAIDPKLSDTLTGAYSFALFREFRTADFARDLAGVRKPAAVLVGADDQLFYAEALAKAVQKVRADIAVELVPGLDHIRLTTAPEGLAAVTRTIERLAGRP